MKKQIRKLMINRETVRNLNGSDLVQVRGGIITGSGNPPCLTTDGACPSGAQSCDPVDCTISLSG